MLVEAGMLSQQQLETALQELRQTSPPMRLGVFLISRGYVQEPQLIQLLSEQLNVERYHSEKYPLDPSLKDAFSEDAARVHECVPLRKRGHVLWVGCLDPSDLVALDNVTETTRQDVEPVICTREELNTLHKALYGTDREAALPSPLGLSVMDGLEDETFQDAEAEREAEESRLSVDAQAGMAAQAPVVQLVNRILAAAMHAKASDVHIMPEKQRISLRFRIDGVLHEMAPPPKSMHLALVSRLKLLSNMDISVSRIPQDGRFSFHTKEREISVRASALPTIHGEKLVLRILDQTAKALTMEELGLRSAEKTKIDRSLQKSWGMLLATGPTGSGKTTLLYSLLQQVATRDINVVTLEDPVEYQLAGVAQVQLNRRAGMTFASGLRAILRQDPDVIMVGEIRDQETAQIAIESALTGHKVLSTLHTNDAPGAVTRFAEMGVEPYLIASTLLLAVAQRLMRRICPDCKEAYVADPQLLKVLGVRLTRPDPHFYRAKGCPACSDSGYKGRVGVYEVLEVDPQVQQLILRGASSGEIKKACLEAGTLRTLRMDAARKVLEGMTSFEEFLRVGAS
ncbi:putative type II secretion system protein E [Megalodesulfovibrio gigas DSM 1382 = ATCC 19364]|uniref:Putative type II secretion system protein E n=2 Tax=Megalodesulfovibrio gigas TaxID=879 RepID=T2G750_MEGG1|nr:putative type II secretion system protein E [Megalodesulfovibrio gigas DSM 1382 = ATCC 19364]